LRGTTPAGIGCDAVDGHMPLVCTHFIQIILDWFVLGAPIALVGVNADTMRSYLTIFYEGLLVTLPRSSWVHLRMKNSVNASNGCWHAYPRVKL
jgi:hypothetical protein